MKHLRRSLIAAAAASLIALAPSAHAQWVVIDPTNLAQNIMTAANTLEQINNQIRQLQNQAQSLMNEAKNLTSLDFSALNELRAALSATNRLIQQAQGLAFNVQQMETQFQQLYPESFSGTVSSAQMVLDARKRWTNSLDALRTATKVQAQAVQNFASDESTLTDLVNRSQSAVGALQATQATNQLLALQARQSMQAQQLQITQDRAVALEQARQVAVQERAREVRRRFTGSGTPYTPATVNFYSE
ncbi:P-type conjugative transfer protein TrbJ [Acidovorax sp. SUPP950]|uniref:P-type conjugative transfer protein TrbJ n=1 Tax=Acidovorax sp. SUPP950 TaxID=511901 RepID=UPI0023CB2F80|nr:P-type conjugative transfer protein TrbJ [Acidovorax sp. SUPP950]GKS77421.1 P-type conjugative transfer protein TrbJ [Acidovorax sp. SUPP950]